jgi:CrcB protein
MERVIWLAAAGALGTLARYGSVQLAARVAPSGFPWAVLGINGVGSFLFGVVWVLAEERGMVSASMRLVVLTGFMGAFTTFSTFAFDTVQLARGGSWAYAVWNVALSNGIGVIAVLAGFRLGRAV